MTQQLTTYSGGTGWELVAAVLRLPSGVGKSTLIYWAVCDGRVDIREVTSALGQIAPPDRKRS